ncbi:MAG: uroporphyrinogen-III C-methyltransferase [Actinobacteria bacterium]|nr:uroporphyrinogen-III C-methyltransferase [Actinomycetota bacterium]
MTAASGPDPAAGLTAGVERLPLFLDLRQRRVAVVGGGRVAARKLAELVVAGARPLVVAPTVTPAIAELAAAGAVEWKSRRYTRGDLEGAWLAFAATNEPAVNRQVVADAEADRVWAVDCSSAAESPAWGALRVPAGDGVTVAVSGGGDPGRGKALAAAVESMLDVGELPSRRVREGSPGSVYLVGGGPGDPELITVRGRRLLAVADVVVMDRLAPWTALATLPADVEVIDVGKAPGRHAMSQEQINDLLVHRARAGKVVVRLKGGDPFVLGRGGEEALACAAAGVPVTVVPGVTSAVSVPAAAGIPVTHRGVAASFLMVSAHTADEALARAREVSSDTTLVLLMGVKTLPAVVAGLIDSGRDPATPVAIVERGWQPGQRTTVGDLTDIAARADAAGVQSPAVVVVGDVVGLRARLVGPEAVGSERVPVAAAAWVGDPR